MSFPVYTRDHRGTWRRLYPISFSFIDRLKRRELPEDVAKRVRRRLGESGRIELRPRQVAGAALSVVLWAGLVATIGMGRSQSMGRAIVVITLVYFAVLFIVFSLRRWAHRKWIVRALLDEARCASCGYDLVSAIPDARALTTCPECSAVWIMPESRQSHVAEQRRKLISSVDRATSRTE